MKALVPSMALFIIVVAAGCTSGPVTVRRDRFNYNDAGAESTKEQILLNIVRLRYGEPIYFVDITSMLSHYALSAHGGLAGYKSNMQVWNSPTLRAIYGIRGEPPQEHQTWEANLDYSDTPTISYAPLTGQDFSDRVMAPIPPTTIIYLSESGWSIDRILETCVQGINDVRNVPLHETEGPDSIDVGRFRRLAKLLKQAQDAGILRLGVEQEAGQNATYLYTSMPPPELAPMQQEVRELLGLPPEASGKIRLSDSAVRRSPDEVAMQTRSVLATMYALAQQIDVPSEHLDNDQAPATRSVAEQNAAPHWLCIEHSRLPQADPFVQVFYNGYWFYIAKTDWSSKRTFALLTYLFSLQSAAKGQTAPLITVPAGR
jgi:hypothetical protein